MTQTPYPRTETPPHTTPLHIHGGDMLAPFKTLGQFWEIDAKGETASSVHYGILEWDPSGGTKTLTLFNDDENAIQDAMEDRENYLGAVCLHGVSIQNLDDGKMGSTRFSIDAFRAGASSNHAVAARYNQAVNHYWINAIWSGDTSVNLHSASYTQMAFSFKGLEKWLGHIPEIKLENYGTKADHIDDFEMDIIRDMRVPHVGRLRLLCGRRAGGDLLFNQTLKVNHQWQIDFNKTSPKTYTECLDIVHAIWDCVNIAIGAVVPLQYVILTKGDKDIERPERFSVRIAHTTADSEGGEAAEVLGHRGQSIRFPDTPDEFWKKWIAAALDPCEKEFSDYVTLITVGYRIANMPQQYEVLALYTAVESITKKMTGYTGRGFPEEEFRKLIEEYTPEIFPEDILDRPVEGSQGLLDWVIQNRNRRIAHIGFPDAVNSYNYPAGIYAERVLRLIAVSLLMLEYELLTPDEIREFYWEGYRVKQELDNTPDKSRYLSIFADGA